MRIIKLWIVWIFIIGKGFAFDVSICAIFQNEAIYLKEWIEYHLLVGVEHFYLYNDRSTDHYQKVLAPYVERGIVDLFNCLPLNEETFFYTQRRAYVRGLNVARGASKWVAFVDLDEFIVPKKDDTISDMLRFYADNLGVMIRWKKFGTSGYWELPKDKLMIECLTKASSCDDEDNFITKSILQLSLLPDVFFDEEYVSEHKLDLVHFCVWEPYDGKKAKNKGPISYNGRVQKRLDTEDAQINHYWCRSEKSYREEKVPRKARLHHEDFGTPYPWPEEKILKYLNLYNSQTDETIQRFVPALKFQLESNCDR
jgi:hypothetical protein